MLKCNLLFSINRYSSNSSLIFCSLLLIFAHSSLADDCLGIVDERYQDSCLGWLGHFTTKDNRITSFYAHNFRHEIPQTKTSAPLQALIIGHSGHHTKETMGDYFGKEQYLHLYDLAEMSIGYKSSGRYDIPRYQPLNITFDHDQSIIGRAPSQILVCSLILFMCTRMLTKRSMAHI